MPSIHYIVVHWLFNIVQAIVIVGIWELMKYLWRLTRG